jgi:hypothetical protein
MGFAAPPSARPPHTNRAWRELGIVALAMAAYFGLRVLVEGDRSVAVRNAERLLDVERRVGIDIEHAVQAWVVERDAIRWFLSASYVWLHWPLLIAAMVFLAFRAPAVLVRLRNAMIMSAAIGVVLFTVFPMAPPRFMPGFVGTVSDAARRHYLPYSLDWTNQFAAFPSYHVGWTLITCLAVASVVRGRVARSVVLLPAAIVVFAVVGTGNHYVLDTAAGAGFALLAWWVAGRRANASVGSDPERQHGDGAGITVDTDERAVGDPGRRAGGRDDARPTELTGHDDRVAHLTADVGDDRLDRHEQRRP